LHPDAGIHGGRFLQIRLRRNAGHDYQLGSGQPQGTTLSSLGKAISFPTDDLHPAQSFLANAFCIYACRKFLLPSF
jgi:hypothetical protein